MPAGEVSRPHESGVIGHLSNLILSWLNLLFELLDTKVEYKLELFELLSLLLELVYLGFTVADLLISSCNLLVKQFDFILMLLKNIFLLLYGSLLVNNIALEALHVRSDILHLALYELQLSLGFQGHVLDLILILLVFLPDLR